MMEPHAGAELEQAGLGSRRCRRRPGFRAARLRATRAAVRRRDRPPRVAAAADVSAGSASSRRRKLSSILVESGTSRGRPNPPANSAGVYARISSSSASGLPSRLADDLIADPRVEGRGERRVQQRARIVLAQALDRELRQARQFVARHTRREHQAHRFRLQTPRNDREDLRRRAIEPLLVIHHADQRLLLGHLGEQAKGREGDEETIGRGPGTDAERRMQGIALREREALEAIQHRRQQLMQPGEGELHLRLDAGGTHHATTRRVVDRVVQERRLAHPRLAAQHQCPALARAHGVDEAVEHVAFAAPAREPCRPSSNLSLSGHRSRNSDVTPPGNWPRRLATGGCEPGSLTSPSAHGHDLRI